MRWIVTGASGMLGQDVVSLLRASAADEVVALGRGDLDITDLASCRTAMEGADVVVNCAAWTSVDAAEDHLAEAFDVNATGASNLAIVAVERGARLVQVSTDYVFDGSAHAPYGSDDALRPVSAYGRSKAAGEWAVGAASSDHLIVRTAWLYGENGPNFARTIARVSWERGRVDVVDDQVGQPTWSTDVADLIVRLVRAEAPGGIYSATSSGQASWFDFARAVVASSGSGAKVLPTTSAAFVRPAPRPAYSVLSHASLVAVGVDPIGDWLERWNAAASSVLGERP